MTFTGGENMELGKKLKQARLDAGLSQRQLCAGNITRNMLSQIENGNARPSMNTLKVLSERLGKPVSWFLEETAVTSVNQTVMDAARSAWTAGDPEAAAQALTGYRSPDPVFDPEAGLLRYLCCLRLARNALQNGRIPYARQLLQEGDGASSPYITPALRAEHILLSLQADPQRELGEALPLDEALLAKAAACPDMNRRIRLLEACEHHSVQWELAMGTARMAQQQYQLAALHLRRAEDAYPRQVIPRLEQCYRELRDFEKAYEYACKQK